MSAQRELFDFAFNSPTTHGGVYKPSHLLPQAYDVTVAPTLITSPTDDVGGPVQQQLNFRGTYDGDD